jgi:L-lactate dehydrogenase complex protein LldF
VYQKIGGQAYGWIYPGPIGAVISPQLQGLQKASELPFASSLCGACKDACPVQINLPDLLLALRSKVKEDEAPKDARTLAESMMMKGYAVMATHPKLFNVAGWLGRKVAQVIADNGKITEAPGPLSEWTRLRDLPAPNTHSFRDWWKENKGNE